MLIPTIVLASVALILLFIGYQKGGGAHIVGLKTAANLLLQVTPLLISAFIIAGMVQVLIPQEMVSNWVGAESGFRGILVGTAFGSITPGGPYICLLPLDSCAPEQVSGPW